MKNYFEKYTPLAKKIAYKYKNYGVPIEDLIQEGLIGLFEASKRFNPEKGSFSTYATYWIKKRIIKVIDEEIQQTERMIRLEDSIYESPKVEENFAFSLNLPLDFPEIEAKILKLYLIEQMPLSEIAKSLNISRERSRYLKEKGLMRLKKLINKKEVMYA